jgi:FkbM family methyltransferase
LNNFIDRSVFFFGAHEKEQLEFSKKFVRNKIVVDCGANFGNHSLYYSLFAKTVISIEPDIVALEKLEQKLKLNSIKNVICLNCGVGSENLVKTPFYCATGDNLGVSSFIKNFSHQNLTSINVSLRTLDSILSELKIIQCDFIKIDVEGFDYEVLQGAHKTISTLAPVIQIEYIPRDRAKLLTFLKENPRYKPRTLIVNRPIFIFNRPSGKLVEFDPNLRSEVFLLPQET